jgi:hypothetical protein
MVRLEGLTKRRSLHWFLEMKLLVALCQSFSDQTTARMCYELLQLIAVLYVCCLGSSTRVDCYISPCPCPRSASGERQDRYHQKVTQDPTSPCYPRTTSRRSPLIAVQRSQPLLHKNRLTLSILCSPWSLSKRCRMQFVFESRRLWLKERKERHGSMLLI